MLRGELANSFFRDSHSPRLSSRSPSTMETPPRRRRPFPADAFQNSPPPAPLFKRRSYKRSVVVLFFVGIIIAFPVDPTPGAVMILSVLASLAGSYYNSKGANTMELFGRKKVSPSMVASQGGAVVAYAISLVVAVATESTAVTATTVDGVDSGFGGVILFLLPTRPFFCLIVCLLPSFLVGRSGNTQHSKYRSNQT